MLALHLLPGIMLRCPDRQDMANWVLPLTPEDA
jgi:hypothetical protein